MNIDPRLGGPPPLPSQDASSRYTLNPIRLPGSEHPQATSGLPSISPSSAHPYYATAADGRPQALRPPLADASYPHGPAGPGPAQLNGLRKEGSKRPRACEACRGLKVRCEFDPAGNKCKRCAKAGRQCITTVPSRKRQKKTDTRVAELERKIDALTKSLHASRTGPPNESEGESSEEEHEESTPVSRAVNPPAMPNGEAKRWPPDDSPEALGLGRKKRRLSYEAEQFNLGHAPPAVPDQKPNVLADPSLPSHKYADVVDRKVLDSVAATNLFDFYTSKMGPHLPAVVFPNSTTAGEIRKNRPILFLAILAVASAYFSPELQVTLGKELRRELAEHVVVRGEKSLEVIQALQVAALWHSPQGPHDTLSYQATHMAATMAIAMGLNRRKKDEVFSIGCWKKHRPQSTDAQSVESRRAWLCCYLLCGEYVKPRVRGGDPDC
jgi:hypothetical protein